MGWKDGIRAPDRSESVNSHRHRKNQVDNIAEAPSQSPYASIPLPLGESLARTTFASVIQRANRLNAESASKANPGETDWSLG